MAVDYTVIIAGMQRFGDNEADRTRNRDEPGRKKSREGEEEMIIVHHLNARP